MPKKIVIPMGDGREIRLEPKRILCNDVVLPGDRNPGNRALYVVTNEYGAMGAVFADSMDEAIDELVDADLAKGILVDASHLETLSEDERENYALAGNAGEPVDLSNVHIDVVPLERNQPETRRLVELLDHARMSGVDTLADLEVDTLFGK